MTETKQLASEPTGPLKGVRIIDLTSVVLGAYATQLLGDLGADIIKIETPAPKGGISGDILRWGGKSPDGGAPGMGPLFMTYNRNKRSIMLDLKKDKAKQVLIKMLKDADVLASNIRYDGMKRLGLSYEEVRAIKPDIIFVHAAGYGSDGPYAGLQAYDDLIQAGSGTTEFLSRVDGDPRPRYLPSLIADKTTGLHMVYAVLAALYHRQRTGEGQFVEVPMLESFTYFTMSENLYGHVFEPPTGPYGYSRVFNPNRRPYQTKDGYLGIVPYSDKQWDDFFALGGKPRFLSSDPRFNTYQARTQNIHELYALIEEVTVTKTSAEWITLLRASNIPAMRVNKLEDVMQDEHLTATGFFEHYEHPTEGTYVNMRHPVRFAASPANIRHHPPTLGGATDEVLREFGLDDAEIAAMRTEGCFGES